jgi:hypothetical protein
MPLIILLAIVLVCTLSVIYVAGIELVSLATALFREVRKHAGVFIVLLFGSGMAAADALAQPDPDIISLVTYLITHIGSFGWVEWLLTGLIAAHVVAVLYVNTTETPNDDTAYGKLYKHVIEPLAGILIKSRAKQKPLSDIHLKQ